MKVYAFPYAFAGANVYNQIQEKIDPRITIVGMNYPGHAERFVEDLLSSASSLAEDALDQMNLELNEEDYVLMGYCIGSYVCIELYHLIVERGLTPPKGIILLGASEPLADQNLDDKDLDDLKTIKEILINYGGTSENLLNNDELIELFAELIKSDCTAMRNYRKEFVENRSVSCPVLLVRGTEEANAVEDLKWQNYIPNLTYEVIEGEHLFLFNPTTSDQGINTIENYILENLKSES